MGTPSKSQLGGQMSQPSQPENEQDLLSANLRRILREYGFTFRDLERLAGIDYTQLTRYGRGDYQPNTRTLNKILRALNIDYAELCRKDITVTCDGTVYSNEEYAQLLQAEASSSDNGYQPIAEADGTNASDVRTVADDSPAEYDTPAAPDEDTTQPTSVLELSRAFGLRCIRLYQYLTTTLVPHEYELSGNIQHCGTQLASTVLQAENEFFRNREEYFRLISRAIDQSKQVDLWLDYIHKAGYINDEMFDSLRDDFRHIKNILFAIIRKRPKKSKIEGEQTSPANAQLSGTQPSNTPGATSTTPKAPRKKGGPSSILPIFILLFSTLFAALFTSCHPSSVDDFTLQQQADLVDVTITLSGLDITIDPAAAPATDTSASGFTRASDKSASEAKITNIDLKVLDAEYNALETISQSSSDEGFGTLSMRLPVGAYTFVAIANDMGSASTIISSTEATVPENAILYSCAQSETICGNTTQTVSLDMGKRKNACFRMKITDATPSDVDAIQFIIAPTATAPTAITFSPQTGLTPSSWKYEKTFTKAAYSFTTFTNKNLAYCLLLPSAETQFDVTINALSAEDPETRKRTVLYTRTLTGVTFKQAYQTTATGTFFSSQSTGSFLFDTTLENNTISLD